MCHMSFANCLFAGGSRNRKATAVYNDMHIIRINHFILYHVVTPHFVGVTNCATARSETHQTSSAMPDKSGVDKI
jgi:hypothetical protein